MWTVAWTSLRSNPRRLVGMCSAVLLGVAFVAGTLVLSDTMRAGFDRAFSDATAGTDVVVRAAETVSTPELDSRPPLSADLARTVEAVPGVDRVVPALEVNAQVVGTDGSPVGGGGPPTIGAAWIDDEAINPYQVAEGRAPAAHGEVVVDRFTARTGDLHVGDRTTVLTPAPVPVQIVGIVSFGDEDSLGGSSLVGFTPDQAREVLAGGADIATSFDVVALDGVDPDDLASAIAAALPDGVETITAEALVVEMVDALGADFMDFFTIFLLVFAGIALLVATFSIHNTFTVVLAQRTRESALFRAVGATRRQVLGGTALEALAIGLSAAVLGSLAGLGLAAGMDVLFDAAGFSMPGSGLVIEVDSLVVAGALGLAVTLVAALTPSIRASRVAPLAALRDVGEETATASRLRAGVGATMASAGGALMVLGRTSYAAVGVGAVLLIVGVVVVGPVLAGPTARLLGALPSKLPGGSAALARGNAVRNPRRTAGTATALLVGVCVVSLFTALATSLKATVTDTVAGSLTADLVLQADGFSGAGMSADLSAELRDVPGVAVVAGFADTPVVFDGEDRVVTATDPQLLDELTDLEVAQGTFEDMGDDGVAAAREMAAEQGWTLGDRIPIAFLDGVSVDARLAATYDRTEIVSDVVVPRAMAEPHVTRLSDWLVLIGASSGADLGALRADVQDLAAAHGIAQVHDLDEFAIDAAGEIDGALAVVYGLLALSIVIALIGIGNTMSLSIHERTRELGLLRAIGQTRRQLRAMVRWESVIVATYGSVLGVLLGTFIAWSLMTAVIADQGSGTFRSPFGSLGLVVLVGAGVGVLASVRPARRAARLDVLEAIAAE